MWAITRRATASPPPKASAIVKYAKGWLSDVDNLVGPFKAWPRGVNVASTFVAGGGAVTVERKGVNRLVNGSAAVTALTDSAMSPFAAQPEAQPVDGRVFGAIEVARGGAIRAESPAR